MYKSTTKCNETLGKWCKNKHGASKIIDTFETYQASGDLNASFDNTCFPLSAPSSNVSIIFYALMLVYIPFALFCCTSWRFYAFSKTNLLTRRQSASSLFSAVFMFQKNYTSNILGIGRNKNRTSYFSRREIKSKDETEGGQGPATP
jgi:hypothetical protein